MTHTEPGLVAFYDIWPGNGAGLFLQPQSQHAAKGNQKENERHIRPSVTVYCTHHSVQYAASRT